MSSHWKASMKWKFCFELHSLIWNFFEAMKYLQKSDAWEFANWKLQSLTLHVIICNQRKLERPDKVEKWGEIIWALGSQSLWLMAENRRPITPVNHRLSKMFYQVSFSWFQHNAWQLEQFCLEQSHMNCVAWVSEYTRLKGGHKYQSVCSGNNSNPIFWDPIGIPAWMIGPVKQTVLFHWMVDTIDTSWYSSVLASGGSVAGVCHYRDPAMIVFYRISILFSPLTNHPHHPYQHR